MTDLEWIETTYNVKLIAANQNDSTRYCCVCDGCGEREVTCYGDEDNTEFETCYRCKGIGRY